MTTARCPFCNNVLTTYKSQPIGDKIRRLRRCKNRKGCGYKEVIVVRPEQILERRGVAG